MGDLISRKAAIGRKVLLEDWTGKEHYAVLVTDIEQLPPAQPEIVRCKDCKFSENFIQDDNREKWCNHYGERKQLTDFCSYAERREVTT